MRVPASIADLAERVRSARIARITGLSVRTVQDLAAAGKIPGAARLSGPRGAWTFNEAMVREWIADEECRACRKVSTAGARHGGGAARLPAASIAEAYERAIGLKHDGGSRRGGRTSKAPASA